MYFMTRASDQVLESTVDIENAAMHHVSEDHFVRFACM